MHQGSCLCKKVTFEVIGDFSGFYLCHCSRCRKQSGSAHCANLFSQTAELKWITGSEYIKTFRLPNTRFAKSFCEACGSSLPTQGHGGIAVPAGSLDSDVEMRPTAHILMASRANWDFDLEHLPKFEAYPNA